MTVHLPRDLNDFELNSDAWTGYFNARGKAFTKRVIDARTVEFTTGPLRPREGITVEISMPSDTVARPGRWKEFTWWLTDNFPYAVFPATLALCLFSWFFRGRDLPGTGTIVVNYESPDGLTPAEVGTLIDEKVDLRDISATIIDLAVRRYLKIEELELELVVRLGQRLPVHQAQGPAGAQGLRAAAVQPDLQRRRRCSAERSPGEVLPGAGARQGRPLRGPEQGPVLRRQPRDDPGDVPRPGDPAGRWPCWPPPA